MLNALNTGGQSRAVTMRLGIATALFTAALPLAGCMPSPAARQAWQRYLQTESDYEACRADRHRPPCAAQWTALTAARAAYHTVEAGTP